MKFINVSIGFFKIEDNKVSKYKIFERDFDKRKFDNYEDAIKFFEEMYGVKNTFLEELEFENENDALKFYFKQEIKDYEKIFKEKPELEDFLLALYNAYKNALQDLESMN